MKLTFVLLTAAFLHVGATGNTQNITYAGKDVTLTQVFSAIKQQTNYVFFYRNDDLAKSKRITIELRNASLESALDQLFLDQPLIYSIKGNTIVISAKPSPTVVLQPTVISPVVPAGPSLITVKGRVVNENGEGVVATVTEKGTKNAVGTNAEGYFALTGVDENATLVITGVSVETREVKVDGKTELGTITTVTKISESETVVVNAGYYKVRKEDQTGSIGRIDEKIISKQDITNPIAALSGRIPGVFIQQTSGVPGSDFKIQIRGQNSLRVDGNEPLYVVDGVPFSTEKTFSGYGTYVFASNYYGVSNVSPLTSINPSDIESIEVLRDADATAIYGSKGANGVVLIDTKRFGDKYP